MALGTGIPKICDTSGEEFCEEHAQAGLVVAEGSSWRNSQKRVPRICACMGMWWVNATPQEGCRSSQPPLTR